LNSFIALTLLKVSLLENYKK